MNLPWYGCSRWTCFVRTRSGSSRLRPREVEIERRVQLVLRDGHGPDGFDADASERLRQPLDAAVAAPRSRRSRRRDLPQLGLRAEPGLRRAAQRRCFSAVTISSGSPNPAPLFSFTSTNASVRPAPDDRSSSLPPAQTFSPRIRQPRSR